MIAAFVTAGFINRSLGPELRGGLAEIQTWVALIVTFLGFSMDTAIYHCSNHELYPYDDRDHFMTVLYMTMFYSFIACLLFFIYVYTGLSSVSPNTIKYFFIMVVLIISTLFSSNLAVFYQSREKIILSAVVGLAQAVINLLLVLLAYYIHILNLSNVLLILIIVQVTAVCSFIISGFKGKFLLGHYSNSLAKSMFIAGIKQHTATVCTFIYTKINQLMVIKYCGEAQAGLFAVSLNLILAAMVVPTTLQLVLYPRVIHHRDDYEVTIKILGLTFYIWGFCILLALILAKPILTIYGGSEYSGAITSFRILLITAWLLPLSSMISPYYIKKGAFTLASISAVFLGIFSILLNLNMIKSFGIVGASWATSSTATVGFLIVLIILWFLSRKNPLIFLNPINMCIWRFNKVKHGEKD